MTEKILEITKRPKKPPILTEEQKKVLKLKDVIITKYKAVEKVNDDGSITITNEPINVNITKLVNEQKKMIKNYSAEEKLSELEKIFTK